MLTIEDFNALLEDPDYHAIPVEMVKSRDPSEKWWDVVSKHNAICAKMQIWEMATLIAILFEKYPETVHRVVVEFEEDSHGGGSATFGYQRFFVNDEEAYDLSIDLETIEEKRGVVMDTDGGAVFQEVVEYMNNMPTVFLGAVEALKNVFGSQISSSQQVLDLARSELGNFGARIDALAVKKALERKRAAAEKEEGNSPQPRAVKMAPGQAGEDGEKKNRKSPKI